MDVEGGKGFFSGANREANRPHIQPVVPRPARPPHMGVYDLSPAAQGRGTFVEHSQSLAVEHPWNIQGQ